MTAPRKRAADRQDDIRKMSRRRQRDERQRDAAEAAIARAVADFTSKIVKMKGRWAGVHPHEVVLVMLQLLSDDLTKLIDAPDVARFMDGEATLKLSNALADYRDCRPADRFS